MIPYYKEVLHKHILQTKQKSSISIFFFLFFFFESSFFINHVSGNVESIQNPVSRTV